MRLETVSRTDLRIILLVQVLTVKNIKLSQDLEECKTQLRAAMTALQEQKKAPAGNILKNDGYHIVRGVAADLTIDFADESGENPGDQHIMRQLEAGKHVLTEVRREKNNVQDANIKLNVELKDVRGQLADSEKENKRLRRGIFSKCLNESFKGIQRRSRLTALCL